MSSSETLPLVSPPIQGALQRYFEIALYLLVLTGFGTLASTGRLGFSTVLLVSMALLFRGYLLVISRTWLVPERWRAFFFFFFFLIPRSSGTRQVRLMT